MGGGCWEHTSTYINIIQYPSISTNILQYDTKNTQLLLDAFGMFLEHLTKYQKKPFCRIETKTIQNHLLGSIKIHQDPLCWGQRFAARSLAMCSHSAREQQSAAAAGVKKNPQGGFWNPTFNILLHTVTFSYKMVLVFFLETNKSLQNGFVFSAFFCIFSKCFFDNSRKHAQ